MNKFGTSDNFKQYQMGGAMNRQSDGFNRLSNGGHNKSPLNNRQFSTLHGALQSEGNMVGEGEQQMLEDEEEPIEEDICDNGESPLINAHTKQ